MTFRRRLTFQRLESRIALNADVPECPMPESEPAPADTPDAPPAEEAEAPADDAPADPAPHAPADANPPAPPSENTESTVTIGDSEVDVVIDQDINIVLLPDVEIIVGTDDDGNLIVIAIVDEPLPDDAEEALEEAQEVLPDLVPDDGETEVTINGEEVDVVGTDDIQVGDVELDVTVGTLDDATVVILEGPTVDEIIDEIVDTALEELQEQIEGTIAQELLEAIEDISPIDIFPGPDPDAS